MLTYQLKKKNSAYKYSDCLDIIYDIVQKYQDTHEIILCGDLNDTLQNSRSNKYDKLLWEFVQELGFSTIGEIENEMTFLYHYGSSSSQFDYILHVVKNQNIFDRYKIWEKMP